MFTGIVEETGKVLSFAERGQAWRLTVEAATVHEGLAVGDSVAVNGCCLTVTALENQRFSFDLLGETVRLTSFDGLQPGAAVNLERSLAANARLGGHFVSGHVDALGTITTLEQRGEDWYLRAEPPAEFLRYLVYKGSIALEGISLTVAEVDDTGFAVWLIPHTLQVTNLRERQPGHRVNLEFDLLAKYVEKMLAGRELTESSTAPIV